MFRGHCGPECLKLLSQFPLGGHKRSLVATDGLHLEDSYIFKVMERKITFLLIHEFILLQLRDFQ